MSSNRPPRIHFDVTQLVHRSGELTGIPRVMNELALRFVHDDNVRFAVWVKEVQAMCEIDFERTMAQRGQGICFVSESELADTISRHATSAEVGASSKRYRHGVEKIVRRGVKRLVQASPSLFRPVVQKVSRKRAGYSPVAFQRGDVLFIPWGEWWDEAFTDCLLRHHREGIKLVQIIHDIAPTVWPQFFERVEVSPTSYNAQILPKAALVLAVSENTKRELELWLRGAKLRVPPIKVFRNGDNIAAAKPTPPQEEQFAKSKLKGGDYLLCVGTIEAKKNHALFYYAYKLAAARDVRLPKLVIAGRRGWLTNDIYEIMTHDPEVSSQFVFLHSVSDNELAWLYDHCLFTVLPSFHEGWGIPVAESLARGIPCLCSNTSSLVEIAPGITEHFSPASADECLAAIQKWLTPKELTRARQKTKKYQPTSWDATFKAVHKYVEEILE